MLEEGMSVALEANRKFTTSYIKQIVLGTQGFF